jgi:hypothetical protein
MGFRFTPGCDCCSVCTEFLFAGNGANFPGGTVLWTNISPGITADDNNNVSAAFGAGEARLASSDHGFSIPAAATITSITVRVEHSRVGGAIVPILAAALTANGAAIWPGSGAPGAVGVSTTVNTTDFTMLFPGMTPAEVNLPTFGAVLTVTGFGPLTVLIDYVSIRVCYNT